MQDAARRGKTCCRVAPDGCRQSARAPPKPGAESTERGFCASSASSRSTTVLRFVATAPAAADVVIDVARAPIRRGRASLPAHGFTSVNCDERRAMVSARFQRAPHGEWKPPDGAIHVLYARPEKPVILRSNTPIARSTVVSEFCRARHLAGWSWQDSFSAFQPSIEKAVAHPLALWMLCQNDGVARLGGDTVPDVRRQTSSRCARPP